MHRTGCNVATRLLLQQERQSWPWGEVPRSFYTYTQDNLINITAQQFSAAFTRTRRLIVSPPSIWTSTSILLRTLWTNVKESSTLRNRTAIDPVNASCSNCRKLPEHTEHLMYSCPLALQMWTLFNEDLVSSGIRSSWSNKLYQGTISSSTIFKHVEMIQSLMRLFPSLLLPRTRS